MAEELTVQHRYEKWKMAIPYLYDCWGPHLSDATFKWKQGLYMSERTDGSDANKLMLVPVEICKPRVAAADTIAGFHEEGKSPFVKSPMKTILHQGEVNKIRELPDNPSIVATHSDSKEVYIWHFDRQPHRGDKKDDKKLSNPDLTLTGHTENAEFALSVSSAGPLIASGGQDTNVLLWNLQDYDSGSLLPNGEATAAQGHSPELGARNVLKGHSQVVGDIAFQPGSSQELASVGDDSALIFWDTRTGSEPTLRVTNAHSQQEIQCMDWNPQDFNLLATGSADGCLKVWDRRNTSQATHSFNIHTRALMRVEWANYGPGVLASGGEDGIICVWDLTRKTSQAMDTKTGAPQELLFQHAGHRCGIADFQWHPTDPFTMVSVTDDNAGGTMHLWRINDLIYRPEAEAIAELEKYKDDILPKDQAPGVKREGAIPSAKESKVVRHSTEKDVIPPNAGDDSEKVASPTGTGPMEIDPDADGTVQE